MRLPRMTTRRWMVAVLIIGLLMGGVVGGYRLRRRYDNFVFCIQSHGVVLSFCREKHDPFWREIVGRYHGPISEAELLREIEYHEAMYRKYRHAALYPWLPVEPDPPEPK